MEAYQSWVILIVDDSRSMRRIVRKFLENNGFNHILEAADGFGALSALEDQEIHLVISDLNMPKMGGMELLEKVKAHERFKKIPFVILTVEAIQKTMNQALGMGVDSYIVKPIKEQLFIAELKRVIQARTSGKNLF